ncbi:flagellar basal body rod protein FlgB [Cellvibrio japonicus]|uniref:Flagellar basal body rod protein FlgB n=1 Tax=Cellvibrio japonicus (strain Ueda107) TaxID=498211 RepID=B3PGS8_CELJU|nr:flagellar basal body rod protein FlgB [Cellvibrio japonicus]ACE84309.1 flagellar basal-body rod protein FlgB [Cellvibrio japonicus Ueda107]QEI12423.1 flagellar basal body rod protein FlgB [Cellvibrio japonicus]QEI15996.1 flagellar basal body rod protein FlgB [Cellvibrio japonicus]QEI19575.1 flagellar basal body rod protein FlgB [Cellvibrio japonicus]
MSISFDKALGIHESALKFRSERASVLANNLANIDTPNYKARDVDFKQALGQQMKKAERFDVATTNEKHIPASTFVGVDEGLLYRVPQQPSIDGNTVEDQIEHAEYMKNALAFQASFQFLNSKFSGLRSAIRGE